LGLAKINKCVQGRALWYSDLVLGIAHRPFAVPVDMSTVDADTIQSAKADDFLPTFPGEDPLKHAGAVWMEAAEFALSRRGLLAVAYGDPPDKLKTIIDFPLELLVGRLEIRATSTMRAA
jgi:hypothetical protein